MKILDGMLERVDLELLILDGFLESLDHLRKDLLEWGESLERFLEKLWFLDGNLESLRMGLE